MAETQGKAQLPMAEITGRPEGDEGEAAFEQGLELGRQLAEQAVRRVGAWAEEHPGQLLLAGVAAGYVLGKLLFRRKPTPLDDL
ncbi:MAG TPA: hypothetical protein VFE90_06830 [Myxococcales bacterium]|jgi:hypothetical protein|nr:hypothetical protein [Myxococcales bacterium]